MVLSTRTHNAYSILLIVHKNLLQRNNSTSGFMLCLMDLAVVDMLVLYPGHIETEFLPKSALS